MVTVVGLFFLRRYQVARNAGGLAKLARQRLDEGKPFEALQLFQRYVGLRPEDTETYSEYAALVLDRALAPDATRKEIATAYNILETAVRKSPDDNKLRAKLAQFQLRISRFTDAREHLDVLQSRIPAAEGAATTAWDPEDPVDPSNIRLMLARCCVATGDFETAVEIVSGLVGYDVATKTFDESFEGPRPADAYIVLAAILTEKLRDPAAADAVMKELVKVDGKNARAWLALSRWERQQGNLDAAKQAIEQATALDPDGADTIFAGFELALDRRDFAQAESIARKACTTFPDDERGYRGLASVYLLQRRLPDAEQALRDGVAVLPGKPALLLMLADTLLQENKVDEVEQTIERVKEISGASSPSVGLFEARVLMSRQQWLEAKAKLEEVRPKAAGLDEITRQVDLYLGECYDQLGEFDQQLEANQRVLNDSPTSVAARVGAASALAAAGRQDEALAEFERVAATIPPEQLATVPQLWLPLLQLRVAAQTKQPVEKRDWSSVDALLESLQQSESITAAQIAALRADVLMRKGEMEAAGDLLEKAVEAEPANGQNWLALATYTLREKGPAAAREVLARAPADLADQQNLLLIDAQIAMAEGGDAARDGLKKIEAKTATLPPDQSARLLSMLAAMYVSIGDRAEATRLWREVADKNPDDLRSRSALFDLAFDEGEVAKVESAAAELEKVAGEKTAQGMVAKAAVKILSARKAIQARIRPTDRLPDLTEEERTALVDARNLLIEAEADRPGWHRIQALFAEIEGLKGDVPGSIERLQKAVELGNTNPAIVRQLVSLLYASNRIEEARKAMEVLGPEGLVGSERLSAEVEMRAGRFEEAIALAERSVAADSRNVAELLWLGQLLERSGKRERALATIERAVEAAPDQPQTWLTLFSLQLGEGKREVAEQTLERAATTLAEPGRSLMLAQGNEMLGKPDDAERYFREATANAPDDLNAQRALAAFLARRGQRGPARESLQRIIDSTADDVEAAATRVWARRTLAELLAGQGAFRDLQAGMALIAKNADEKGRLPPEDMALQIQLLANRPEPASWRQAIDILEQLEESQPLSMGQQLQLAQLRERAGRWEEARNGMISIASSPNTPPAIIALLIEKLVAHDEITAARTWLRRLKASLPEAPATFALEAKVAIAEKDRETAVAAARRLMPGPGAAANQAGDLETVAKLLEELGFAKAADRVFTQLAATSADGAIERAEFLGRQKQGMAALDLLEQTWDKVPLERLLQTAVTVLRGQDATDIPAYASRLDPWFAKAAKQEPGSVVIPLLLAEMRDTQGRTDEVEGIYRGLLAREGIEPFQSAVITNNLAFHLAKPETVAEAKRLIDAAIEELGPHPDLLDTRGIVHLAAGEYDEAVTDFKEAILNPSAPKFLHLASAQLQKGDTAAAQKALEEARRQGLARVKLSAVDQKRLEQLEAALGPPPEA